MIELLNLPDLSLCLRYNFLRKRSVVKSRRSTLTLHQHPFEEILYRRRLLWIREPANTTVL
jgi:hypothetical protein